MIIEKIEGMASFEEIQNMLLVLAETIRSMENTELEENKVEGWCKILDIRIRSLKALAEGLDKYKREVKYSAVTF